MELIAAQAKITELSRELSEARRRSPSSESTVTSSSFWPSSVADTAGVEDLIRELRQCQEERAIALEEASAASCEAAAAQAKFNAEQLQHDILRSELKELAAWRYPASQLPQPDKGSVERDDDPIEVEKLEKPRQLLVEESVELDTAHQLYQSELQEARELFQSELREAQESLRTMQHELAEAQAQLSAKQALAEASETDSAQCLTLRAELRAAQEEARQANTRAAAASKAWGR